MREYETVYVLKPDLDASHLAKVSDRIKKVLSQKKASILNQKDWGKRKLAYRIKKFQFGHYLYIGFEGEGSVVPELEKILKYDEDVLRFLTVRVDQSRSSQKGQDKEKVVELEEFQLGAIEPRREFRRPREFEQNRR